MSKKHTNATYRSWLGMRDRCSERLTNKDREYYFLKGITVCKEWDSFEQFVADLGERPEGTSIDRIDSSKGYYKENCKWSTVREQNRNRKMQPSNTGELYISLSNAKYFIVNVRPFKSFCRSTLEEAVLIRNELLEIKNRIDIKLIEQLINLENK